ncbi:hypothetical protein H0H93_003702 [Arthromyces matolae]|nr:hypothetical protein H0H93_003702 [Arthromyces matolae]
MSQQSEAHQFNFQSYSTPTRTQSFTFGADPPSRTPISASQGRLRAPKRSEWQKIDDILAVVQKDFKSIGSFLEYLFHNAPRGSDPRTARHRSMVSAFLQGSSNVHMGNIITLIYKHRQSNPTKYSSDDSYRFSPHAPLEDIRHARPCMSAWAAQLVGEKVFREVRLLTQNDPLGSEVRTQLRATRSERSRTIVPQVTWDDLGKFSIPELAKEYKRRAPLTWHLAESMAAPRRNGKIIFRQRRPYGTVVVGAISAFSFARNKMANYLPLTIGIWQFACKAHIDTKRILSRFGYSVHDSTIRECLNSLADSSLLKLQKDVAEGLKKDEVTWKYILDNVQRYDIQREHRIGRQANLKVGTAATAIKLEDCAPGAFNLADHLERVMKMERKNMTTWSIFSSIDWEHQNKVQALHWLRVLVGHIDELADMRAKVSHHFRGDDIAKHRMREGRKTVVQPLGTNAEKEVETQGMMRALLDFEKQMGLDEKALEGKIVMPGGDGASFAAILRTKKYMAQHESDYQSFRGRLSVPELWHTRATNLNALAENHYGPVASPDPSSMSKSATAANTKRPSNLKKCDFYPTARSVFLFFEARVLDCWRIHFEVDDLAEYFRDLGEKDDLPHFEDLLEVAGTLVYRYSSQEAYMQALSKEESLGASNTMKIPEGKPWTASVQASEPTSNLGPNVEETEVLESEANNLGDDVLILDKTPSTSGEKKEKFDGDQVLANEILFLQDAGWWIEASYAIPEGDIGRVYEIIKEHQIVTMNLGYDRLESGRLKNFLDQSLPYARHLADMKGFNNDGDSSMETDLTNTADEDIEIEKQDRPMPGQGMFLDEESGTVVIESEDEEDSDIESSEDEESAGKVSSDNEDSDSNDVDY